MRGCHSPDSGRITARRSSWPQSTRIVQRERRRALRWAGIMVPAPGVPWPVGWGRRIRTFVWRNQSAPKSDRCGIYIIWTATVRIPLAQPASRVTPAAAAEMPQKAAVRRVFAMEDRPETAASVADAIAVDVAGQLTGSVDDLVAAAHRHDMRVGRLSARHSDIHAFRLKPLDLENHSALLLRLGTMRSVVDAQDGPAG
jgi:hypothetical protein